MAERRDAGFTMLEVLLAALIVSLVFGVLLGVTSQLLSRLGRSQDDIVGARLAEQRIREMEALLSNPEDPIPEGVSEGVFEEPHDGLAWQVKVEPWQLPLPAGFEGDSAPSPLFAAPAGKRGGDTEAVIHRVEVRVYRDGDDPEDSAEPFVLFSVTPSEALADRQAGGSTSDSIRGRNAAFTGGGGGDGRSPGHSGPGGGPKPQSNPGQVLCNGRPARNGLERWMAANGQC